MSDTPEGGPGSGMEGFAPPDGGFVFPVGDAPPTQDAIPVQPAFPPPPAPPQYPQNFWAQPLRPGYGPGYGYGYAPQLYPGGYYGPPMLRQQTSGLSVAGMVLGIASLLLFWAPLMGPLIALAGLVFSALGMSQGSKPGWTGKGMAIAGLVCSLVTLVIWVILAALVASLIY